MDPNDVTLNSAVTKDIERIVAKETRVQLIDLTVYTADHAISADIQLRYLPFNNVDSLYLIFEKQINEGIE
jgi:hypothetical protein